MAYVNCQLPMYVCWLPELQLSRLTLFGCTQETWVCYIGVVARVSPYDEEGSRKEGKYI